MDLIEYSNPSLWQKFLLVLLLTGPPKFRVRDVDAAAYGEVDFAALVQLVVWLIAGVYTYVQFFHKGEFKLLRVDRLHKFSFLVIATMAISIVPSVSPVLTGFKVFQVLVAFLFSWFYVERFGAERFLRMALVGAVVMAVCIAVLYLVNPESVMSVEMTGEYRMRGQAIYEASHVAFFGLTLTLFLERKQYSVKTVLLLLYMSLILLYSMARIDWLAFGMLMGLAFWLKPDIPGHRWIRFGLYASPLVALYLLRFLARTRDLDTLYATSERAGLWLFIILNTLESSPWLGNGFIAGTRLLGMEYDVPLPSGHSIFIDAFGGCGLLGLVALLILVTAILVSSYRILKHRRDAGSFAVASLSLAMIIISCFGAEIEATPFGVLFWGLVPALAQCMRQIKAEKLATPEQVPPTVPAEEPCS